MTQTIREIMTPDPISLSADSTIAEAAKDMREADIGSVIVLDQGEVCGIVTDRDIVIRAIAQDKDPARTSLRDICSKSPTTLSADSPIDQAVGLMRQKAIRRLPVVDGGQPVGIVSLGDLALDRDPRSTLANISQAAPNK